MRAEHMTSRRFPHILLMVHPEGFLILTSSSLLNLPLSNPHIYFRQPPWLFISRLSHLTVRARKWQKKSFCWFMIRSDRTLLTYLFLILERTYIHVKNCSELVCWGWSLKISILHTILRPAYLWFYKCWVWNVPRGRTSYLEFKWLIYSRAYVFLL